MNVAIMPKLLEKIMRDLITETISTINSTINNIYTKIDRDDCSDSFEERELVERFNELVKIEQHLIDILHPNRHDDYDIPKPKFLRYNITAVEQHLLARPHDVYGMPEPKFLRLGLINGVPVVKDMELVEVEDDYERSDHLKYMVMAQDMEESGF